MKSVHSSLFAAIVLVCSSWVLPADQQRVTSILTPPFKGTIFLDPDIITEDDPTTFEGMTPEGIESREMFDRRVDGLITADAYIFTAEFSDGLTAQIQVNAEFGSPEAAQVEADKYATVIGRLPTTLRKDVKTITIHQGDSLFGGGNNDILIHVGQAAKYEAKGILEETLFHEASHTSMDDPHATAEGWIAAQKKDPTFISTYAQDNPEREDIAETFLLYVAVRYRSDRISKELKETVMKTIPNRIKYLDSQQWDLFPLK